MSGASTNMGEGMVVPPLMVICALLTERKVKIHLCTVPWQVDIEMTVAALTSRLIGFVAKGTEFTIFPLTLNDPFKRTPSTITKSNVVSKRLANGSSSFNGGKTSDGGTSRRCNITLRDKSWRKLFHFFLLAKFSPCARSGTI